MMDNRQLLEEAEEPDVTELNSPPPSYSEIDENQPNTQAGDVEQPPPYTPSTQTHRINCKICQSPISLEGRQNLHVVNCPSCNEATPVRCAPPGKKYVRCPCNCLIICSVDIMQVYCPRESCLRLIVLPRRINSSGQRVAAPSIRATCAHCNNVFVFLRMNVKYRLAICPHCTGRSSVGKEFIRRKFTLFAIIGAVFLLAGIVSTIVSETTSGGVGILVIWIGAYVVGLLNLLRALMYCCVKVSEPIEA